MEYLRQIITALAAVGLFFAGFALGVGQPKESSSNSLMLRRVVHYVDQGSVECLVSSEGVIVSCDGRAYTTQTPVVSLCSMDYCKSLLRYGDIPKPSVVSRKKKRK